jgi:glycine cleavage system H lipoate-binding protein
VLVVISALCVAAKRGLSDLNRQRAGAIEWEETFHDLPQARRHCRHEYDGAVDCRICDHGFDCETCTQHPEFAAHKGNAAASATAPVGMGLVPGRLYHRGHTWVEKAEDGTMTVGMDDFARRCFGRPDRLLLPACGSILQSGQRGATLERDDLRARIAVPVSGEVVAVGGLDEGWLYRIRPIDEKPHLDHLLQEDEARVWMLRELEWLQGQLSPGNEAMALADGGTLVDDFMQEYPRADWDSIWGQVCLEA